MADFALITMICLLSSSPSTLIGVYDLSNSNNNNYRNQLMQESQNQLMQESQNQLMQESQNHKFLHQHQIQHHHHHQQQQQHRVVRQHQQSMCANCDFTPDPGTCHMKCSNGLNHPMLDIGRQAAAMVAQQQQQQQIPNDEQQQQQQQSSPTVPSNTPAFVTTPMIMAAGTTNPTTASMISSPTTSTLSYTPSIGPPSGGKMNPHDVTFLLYTRYQRELFNELVQLNQLRSASVKLSLASVGHNPGTVSLIPSTASSVAASSITASPANLGGGQVVGSGQGGQTGGGPSAQSLLEGLVSMSEIIDINNDTSLNESHLNSSLPIKIIIHGFGSGGRRPWVTDMVHKLLDYEDVNVIVVDWEKGAALPNYVYAAGNTRIVGHRIATLIKSINAKHGLTGNRYHLIGFSLGAHVAGFAGMEIRNSTNISRHWINRITGLDPASPLFEGYEINDRLDPSDAQFVDVIHSNGDGVLRGGFGSLQPMGHVDFYPNGGRVQVGCNSVILSALSDIIYGKWQSLCNHRRALNFFMDSFEFSKCRFRSFNCDSYESYLRGDCFDCGPNNEKCSYMGYLANYSKGRGKMYLTTHEEAPFCANQFIIKIIGSKGYKTHWGKVEVTLVTLDGKHESFWLSSINSAQSSSSSSSSSSTSSSTPLSSSTISPLPSSTSSSSLVSSASSTSTLSPLASASSLPNPASLMGSVGSPLSSSNSQSGSTSSSSSINQDLLMGTSSISSSSSQSPSQRDQLNQQSMQSLIVAHPTLVNFTQVHLRYTKYKGWIYSGDENWPIDKVLITDSDGQVKSFCGYNTILESHITTRLNLEPGNCSVIEQPNSNTHAWMSEVM